MTEAAVSVTNTFAKRVRRARLELGLDQREFATRLGVHEMTVSHWETGKSKPKVARLQALSRLTGRPISYFTELIPDDEL